MCRIVVPPNYWHRLEEIGKKCKEIRIQKGYTQKEVAEKVMVNPSLISAFESGRTNSALILNWYVENGYRG